MKSKLINKDIISLALLYNYIYSSESNMVLTANSIYKFIEAIDYNLERLNNTIDFSFEVNESNAIYFLSKDENGKKYYILKDGFDIVSLRSEFIEFLPKKIILASQMYNALSKINLIKIDDNIIEIDKYYDIIKEKYNITKEEKNESQFDIFRDLEKIEQDTMLESILTLNEKKAFQELKSNKEKILKKEQRIINKYRMKQIF
mgnify:FL=1